MPPQGPRALWCAGAMDDDDRRLIPHMDAMFTTSSLAKADLATDLAIQLLADGGWSALTLRNMARAANMTPQAIAAWFPSAAAMRAAIAGRYGERWLRKRGTDAHHRLYRPLSSTEPLTVAQVALALLPATWLEETFAGVWLTIVEAGRWEEGVAASVAELREAERDLVLDLLTPVGCRDETQREDLIDVVLTVVQGCPLPAPPHTGPCRPSVPRRCWLPHSAAPGRDLAQRRAYVGEVDERGDREDQVDDPERRRADQDELRGEAEARDAAPRLLGELAGGLVGLAGVGQRVDERESLDREQHHEHDQHQHALRIDVHASSLTTPA